MNQEKIDIIVVKAKKAIASMVHHEDMEKIPYVQKVNHEACFVVAGFKCQKCGCKEKLTLHHLIMRKAKDFMDFWRYASQRYYWANQIILCKTCHAIYHNFLGEDIGESMGVVTDNKLNKYKVKYADEIIREKEEVA